MKKLCYDLDAHTWYQTFAQGEKIFLGKFFAIPYREEHPKNYLSFPFCLDTEYSKAGPLVGILASPKKEGFIGNIGLFKRIQHSLHQTGGNSIVFVPDQLSENGLSGFCYLPNHDHWIKMETPLPDIIYNRLATHNDESIFLESIQNIADLYHIPLFNPRFFDKWELHLQLKSHEGLAPYLPDTELLSEDSLADFLSKYSAVYVKKRNSNRGSGIYLIARNGHTYLLKTTSTTTILFPSIKKLIKYFKKANNLASYIVQQAIPTMNIEGKKFDYRILSHIKDKSFEITGIGVRLAKTQQVTTHVPAGGEILSLDNLPFKADIPTLELIIKRCGKQLSGFYDYLGEFSADIGVTPEGKHYLFELNSKPMDFDEPAIKQAATEKLTNVFHKFCKYPQKEFTR